MARCERCDDGPRDVTVCEADGRQAEWCHGCATEGIDFHAARCTDCERLWSKDALRRPVEGHEPFCPECYPEAERLWLEEESTVCAACFVRFPWSPGVAVGSSDYCATCRPSVLAILESEEGAAA